MKDPNYDLKDNEYASINRKFDRAEPKGGFKLQFEVNGQAYFLAFVEEERRWYVFAPTTAGVRRIPVYMDAPPSAKIVLAEEGKPTISN